MLILLDNEEAGGGGSGAGALHGQDQTVVARLMLTSAKVTGDESRSYLF